MFLPGWKIDEKSLVADIVTHDYRTADVFRKYDIEYCCGAKWTLNSICIMKDLDINSIKTELEQVTRNIQLPNCLHFDEWSLEFLADYIVNVHHSYLNHSMPIIKNLLKIFVADHFKKYPQFIELETVFLQLYKDVFPHMKQEEEVLFPYIKQVFRAYQSKESYAGLLVKTLRKPIEGVMAKDHETVINYLHKFRYITNNYHAPSLSCISHRVCFAKLKELDNDLAQHIHLENNILFPKALAIEKELLKN